MRSAELLGTMCPDAGHMNHMPSHIYVLCGEYEKARLASEKADRANDLYLAYADEPTYYLLGCCHDLHLMMFTCMLLGQYGPALWAADKVRSLVTRDVVSIPGRPKLTQTVEGYHAMKSHVQVRFGRWQDIIDEPMVGEPELYVLTTAMQHYAKGVAHATLRDFAARSRSANGFTGIWRASRPSGVSSATRPEPLSASALLCSTASLPITRADMTRPTPICGRRWSSTTICPTPSLGVDAPAAPCTCGAASGSGSRRRGRTGLSGRSGLSGKVQRCTQHPDNVWALHGLVECLNAAGRAKAARVAGQAGRGAGQGGRADQLVLPVQDKRAIRAELLSPDKILALLASLRRHETASEACPREGGSRPSTSLPAQTRTAPLHLGCSRAAGHQRVAGDGDTSSTSAAGMSRPEARARWARGSSECATFVPAGGLAYVPAALILTVAEIGVVRVVRRKRSGGHVLDRRRRTRILGAGVGPRTPASR